jgi:hypothetical protein
MTFKQNCVVDAGRVKEVAQFTEVVVNVDNVFPVPQLLSFTMASLLQLWSDVVTTITCVWWYVTVVVEVMVDDPELT